MARSRRAAAWLRELDERSGAKEYAASRLEFFAPGYVVGTSVMLLIAVTSALRGNLPATIFGVVGSALMGLQAFVGMRHRRARNRDPW